MTIEQFIEKSPQTKAFIQQFPKSRHSDVIAYLLTLGTVQAQSHLYKKFSSDKSVLTPYQALNEIKFLASNQYQNYGEIGSLKQQLEQIQQKIDLLSVDSVQSTEPLISNHSQDAASSNQSLERIKSEKNHFRKSTGGMVYPSWWGEESAIQPQRRRIVKARPEKSIPPVAPKQKEEWIIPKKLVDESCQTNPQELERMSKLEFRDQQLRKAARKQIDPKDISGFDYSDVHQQIPNGWIPFETPKPKDRFKNTQSAPQPSKRNTQTTNKNFKSIHDSSILDNQKYKKSVEQSNGRVKDFIDIANDIVKSDFVKALQ